jgi:hypothetical protein
VFGRSLGGTMATHIAFNYPDHISFLFSDRSLGSLDCMVEASLVGKFTKKIFNHFSSNWVINSDVNFYEAKCFKMMTQDPNDLTVSMFSALST